VPGNFGLLDSPTGQGARDIAELLASSNPNSVCVGNTVDLKPGQTQGASTGINTRFDMFDNPFFGAAAARNNPNYRPARNVTKGLVRTNPCTYAAPALPNQAMSLPRDPNLSAANRFGNGAWNCAAYWAINHPGVPAPAGCTNPASISRYAIYRHEIATAIPNNAPAGEDGNPRCYSGPAAPEQPDRRVVYFAVINCLEQGPIRGNASGVKVKAFAKAFVTEPVGNPPDSDFYLEVIDVVKPGADDGVLHDIVQIYR
jgi:hypothetical protein